MKNKTKYKKLAEYKYKKNRTLIKETAYKFKIILKLITKNKELLNSMNDNSKKDLKELEKIWCIDSVLTNNIKTLLNFKQYHPHLNTFFNKKDDLYENAWLDYIKSGMDLRLTLMEYSILITETGLIDEIC